MQTELFHETAEDAIGATINEIGGFNRVASDLWPAMKLSTAYARLKACLNEDKAEKLSLSEIETIVRWGREKGVHYYMRYMAQATGYTEPDPADPEDEYQKTQRQFIEATKHMDTLMKRMEKLHENGLRAVK